MKYLIYQALGPVEPLCQLIDRMIDETDPKDIIGGLAIMVGLLALFII